MLTTLTAPRERLVLDALLEELGHETGVPRNLAEPHALGSVEAGVARVRGRDADVESAEGPFTSRGRKDVSWAQARRGLKEAQHLRLGSQDDVAHFVVARSRRPAARTSTKESCSRWREDRGLSSHIHSWDVVSSHRSAMRARVMPCLRAVLGREPLRQFGDAEVIDHGREAVLKVLRGRRGGVLSILDARLDK